MSATNISYNEAQAITVSNTVNLTEFDAQQRLTDAIYVGSNAGNMSVVMQDDTVIVFKLIPVGTIVPVRCKRVNATGTTSTDMVALYLI